MLKIVLAGAALVLASPALAQSSTPPDPRQPGPPVVVNPAQVPERVVVPGGPDVANGGPASTGSVVRSGTGAETMTNNPGGDSNAMQPERGVSTTSGGGGGDGGGG